MTKDILTEEFTHEMKQTSAVFGRNDGVQVYFEGDRAYTDGKNIVLPSLPQDVVMDGSTVRTMRGYVDREAGHIRHSDFHTIEELNEENKTLGVLHNPLEDTWIEPKVMSEYLGSSKNFLELNEFIKENEIDGVRENPDIFNSINQHSVTMAIAATGIKNQHGTDAKNNRDVMDLLPQNLKDHADRWVEEVQKCSSSSEVANITRAVYKYLEQDPELEQSPDDFDPTDFELGKGEPDPDHPLEEGEGKDQGEGNPIKTKEDILDDMLGERIIEEGNHKGAYRVLSDRDDKTWQGEEMKELFNGHRSHGGYDEKKAEVQSDINVMKTKLRRALLSRENRDWDYGREVGRLDTKRLVAGYNGNQSVFKARKDRDEMDTAIEILIDLSGSMHGSRVMAANQMAIALAECFEGTQIKYEITGFNNGGCCSVLNNNYGEYKDKQFHRIDILNTYVFKDFTDKLFNKRGTVGRIDGYVRGCNSDRDAVMWAHNRLRSRTETRKILLVLSDGEPANSVLGDIGSQELERHLTEYVKGIKDVECIGVGIETDHVTKLYPNSVVVHDMSEFSQKVMGELSNVLTGGKLRL